MTPTPTQREADPMREAFEALAKRKFSGVTNPAEPDPGNPDGYYWPAVHNAWIGWQAAWTSSRQAALEEAAHIAQDAHLACDSCNDDVAAAIRQRKGE